MRIAMIAGLLFAAGAGSGPLAEAHRLRVVATVPDLAAIAREVGGGSVGEVSALLLPTQDPHFADARPHLVLQLNRASLLLLVGLGLEAGWLPTLLDGARNPALLKGAEGHFDASRVAVLKEVPRRRVDRSMGDVHPGGNPHYLLDPGNAVRVARALAERMARLDPSEARSFRANAERFARNLEEAHRRWRRELAPYRGVPVVTYHRSLLYLTEALGLHLLAEIEPKPGIPPSAAHILGVVQLMRARKVPLVVQEEYYPDRTARLVAQKSGARLVSLPGGADLRGGQSFQARLQTIVHRLLEALPRR